MRSSAVAWSVMMYCHRCSARSVNTLLKTRRPRVTLFARTVNALRGRAINAFTFYFYCMYTGMVKTYIIYQRSLAIRLI